MADGTRSAARIARVAVWLAAAAAGAQLGVGAANEVTLESDFLNPDEEGSLFQLLTAAVTAAAGVAAAAHALRLELRRRRFVVLAAGLLYLAADDVLVIHEWLGEHVGERLFGLPDHLAVRMWIPVLAPLLVAVFVLLVAEAFRAGPGLRRVLAAGLGALAAALVVEVVGAVTRSPSFIEEVSGKPETLRYLVEEAFELGGWILVGGALWGLYADDRRAHRSSSAASRRSTSAAVL